MMLSRSAWAVDMQAHVGSDEAKQAYSTYVSRQAAYYTGSFTYSVMMGQSGANLFGSLNTLMGNTIDMAGKSYNTLRDAYVGVDRDLNTSGYIIGYYDGYSFRGVWDSGSTWNREHTWPQSKGADKGTHMGHDMQSVRPTRTAVNSNRGNTPYGEGSSYYNPDRDCSINNPLYNRNNNGTYRGDAARVIMYDYIVYGQMGSHQNKMYNGNAQLLSKLGSSGVFESLYVMLKWHMQDPPSLTEMVRNDGAQDYQGNRNPFIDYPELAPLVFEGQPGLTLYTVTNNSAYTLYPAYTRTVKDGFVTYVTYNGAHPATVTVTGATANYNPSTGRLTLTNVTGAVTITSPGVTAVDNAAAQTQVVKVVRNGQVYLLRDDVYYDLLGRQVEF